MRSERRRKQLLRATHSIEYTSLMSASIADIIRREVFASSQISRSVAEFRRTLYMLHDYNTLVFKCTYNYPISTETKLLLRRYVELESYVLYKSKWTPEIEDQVQKRVFKTVMYFISGSYHATGQSIAEDRKLIFDEALKIFIHFADVSIDRFPAKILRNILTTLGIVNISANSESALYINNPSLKRLKEYLRDSDYGSDDDSVESSEETGIKQSSLKIHNEKKLLEKPSGVKSESNSSNNVRNSLSYGSLSMPFINSSPIHGRTRTVNLLSRTGNELSTVGSLGAQSVPHRLQQVSSQIRRSGDTTPYNKICTMFQTSDLGCNEKKGDFDSKPIMNNDKDDFECIPTDFGYILDKRKRNISTDEFACTSSNQHLNMTQLTQYGSNAPITKLNEFEPMVNLTAIPEFPICISEQKMTATVKSNIGNMTSTSAINMHSELSKDAIFPSSYLKVNQSIIQVPLRQKTVSGENRDKISMKSSRYIDANIHMQADNSFNSNILSLNQTDNLETIFTDASIHSDDTYTTLSNTQMFSGCNVGTIQNEKIIDEGISTKVTPPVHSNNIESQVEGIDCLNDYADQSHFDTNNSYQNINVASEPVKGTRIQEVPSLKEKNEQYKLMSPETTIQHETEDSNHLTILSENNITQKILSDETQKHPSDDCNKLHNPLTNLSVNADICEVSENSYENIGSASEIKSGDTFNPISENLIADETSTTMTTQLYPESHQAQKNNTNINMIRDSSTITILENSHQNTINNFTLDDQFVSDKQEVSLQENAGRIGLQLSLDKVLENSSPNEINVDPSTEAFQFPNYKNSKHKQKVNHISPESGIKITNIKATIEHTSKKISETESHILEKRKSDVLVMSGEIVDQKTINSCILSKLDEKSPESTPCLGEEKKTICDNHKVHSHLEKTVISCNISDNKSLICKLASADKHGAYYKVADVKMARLPEINPQPDTENIDSSPIVEKLDKSHLMEVNNCTGETKLVSKEQEEFNNRNNTIIQLKTNFQTEEKLGVMYEDNPDIVKNHKHFIENVLVRTCVSSRDDKVIISENKNNIVFGQSLVSNDISDVSSTNKTQQSTKTFNFNRNGESSAVVSLENLQQNIINDFVDTEFVSTKKQRHSQESGNQHQLPVTDAEWKLNFQNDVNDFTPKISQCLIKDSENINTVNKELPHVSQKEIIEVGNNLNASLETDVMNDNMIMRNEIEEQKTKKYCLSESNENTLAENPTHSDPGLTEDVLIICNEEEKINSVSDQSADSINTKENRSSNCKQKSEDSFENVKTLPFSDDSSSPNIHTKHASESDKSDQIASDLNVNSNTIETPVTSETSNQHMNNDFYVKTRLDVDEHEAVPMQGNNSQNQSSISSKASLKNKNTNDLTSSEQKAPDLVESIEGAKKKSASALLEARADDNLNVVIEYTSVLTRETKVDANECNKEINRDLLEIYECTPKEISEFNNCLTERHSSTCGENQSSMSKNKKAFHSEHKTLVRESDVISGVNEIEEVMDSSSKKVVKINSNKADSGIREITEGVDINTNITTNVEGAFETELPSESIDESSSKIEDKTIRDYIMQDPNMIESTSCENISDGVNELKSVEELKSISELKTPSKALETDVTCLNQESDLITSGNEILEVIDSSSQKEVKTDLDKPDSGITEITECVDMNTNVTTTLNKAFEMELPSQSIDHDPPSKKDKITVSYVMQDPNLFETTFCENIPDGVNEQSIAELKSISEFSSSQESERPLTPVTCLNQESGISTTENEIEEIIDSSSKNAVKFDLDRLDSTIKEITECVDIDTNITNNDDNAFEIELQEQQQEDKKIVDYVTQDPNEIDISFGENVSDAVNEIRPIAELKSSSKFPIPTQKSETVVTSVICINQESNVISGNKIEEEIDSSTEKEVKIDIDKPDSGIRKITECVDIDINVTTNVDCAFETDFPLEIIDHNSSSKKEDKITVDYVMQDPNVIETAFCENIFDEVKKKRSIAELKSTSEFPTPSAESETDIAYCLNQESIVISSINEIEEIIDSSSKEVVTFDSDNDSGIKEIAECVIDTNVTINVDGSFGTEPPTESIDLESPSKKKDKTIIDYVMQDQNMIETTFCEHVSDGVNELRSIKKLQSTSEFLILSQDSETAVTCHNQESDFITSENEIVGLIDSSTPKEVKIDSAKPDWGIRKITVCVNIDTNVDTADEADLQSKLINHNSSSKKEDKITVDYVMQDPKVIETTICEHVSDGVNELRSIEELQSISEFIIPSHDSETAVTCHNQESDFITSENEIVGVIDSSTPKEVKIDSDKPDWGIRKITECVNIDTNVDTTIEADLCSELIDHNSSSKKEDKITVDYVMQNPKVIGTTICEHVSDGVNELRSIEELQSISEFIIPSQDSETAVSCQNQESHFITSENEIVEVIDSSTTKEVKIDSKKPDCGIKKITECVNIDTNVDTAVETDLYSELIDHNSSSKNKDKITVDYVLQDPNVIETAFCENISDEMNKLRPIVQLESISEFPTPPQESERSITPGPCLNQEPDVITSGYEIEAVINLSSQNDLKIDLDKPDSDIKEITAENVIQDLNVIETTIYENVSDEVSDESIAVLKSVSELPNPTHQLETAITTISCINQESTSLTNNTFSDNSSSNFLSIEKNHKCKETSEMIPTCEIKSENSFEKINEVAIIELGPGINQLQPDLKLKVINPTDSLHSSLMKENEISIEDTVNQQITQIMPKRVLRNSTESKIYEKNSSQKVKSLQGKKNSSQAVTKYSVESDKKKRKIAENSNTIITNPNTTELKKSHVIAESSLVNVNEVHDVPTNQETDAKTPDSYSYVFQGNSLPDELKMLADVASNRKHMKVAHDKKNSKRKVMIRNQAKRNCKRKNEYCNNKKTVSKSQKAKNSRTNYTDMKSGRIKNIDEKLSSHTMKKKEIVSLFDGKTCIEKPQKLNDTLSQPFPVSNRKRIKTLGELKHFDISSFEKSYANKLTDQLEYCENISEKNLRSVKTIDTMKDSLCETEFSLDKNKLVPNTLADSETTEVVSIDVLDDALEKRKVSLVEKISHFVKVDKNPPVFSEKEGKNEQQTDFLKNRERLENRKTPKKIAKNDNEKSLQNNPKENVKVIVEEIFPMEYSGDKPTSIRPQINPLELSGSQTEFVPCNLGVYTFPIRPANIQSTANNVNVSTTEEIYFKEKTEIFSGKNSEYKCGEYDLNNQKFDQYGQTSSENNAKVTDISNLGVTVSSTHMEVITESCKNERGCSEKRKCTFDEVSSSSKNNEKKLLENTSRKNKRKHSPKKILLDNELNTKAKEMNAYSVDDNNSKPKEIRKSIEHIVTSLKSCNSRDICGSSDYAKPQPEVTDYNTDIKLFHSNVGNKEISSLNNDECNKIVSHLNFNQINLTDVHKCNQKQSNTPKCENTNHPLEVETKETEDYKISSNETCSNLCESEEAENTPCQNVYCPNLPLSNDNTVTQKQISIQEQNMDCVNEIEKPISMDAYSHLSEEQRFVDKISSDMFETLCAQKVECSENSSNCMETLVETVASVSGQNSNNVPIPDEFESKLPVDDLSFLIEEANNSFERTNFVFSTASEVSRILADTNTSQISESFDQNSVMNPEEFDIRLVNSSFLETFVNGFPFCNHDYGYIGSEVTVSSNIPTDPLVGGQEEPNSNKEELSMDDTDGTANNLLLDAPSFNEFIFMYGQDNSQAIAQQSSLEYEKNYRNHPQINSQKLSTEYQNEDQLPQTNSQQSSFADEKNDLKHSQTNSQEALTVDKNSQAIAQQSSLEYEKNYRNHPQINSQKLSTEYQNEDQLPQTNSQQSSFADEKNDLKHSQTNSQDALTVDKNDHKLFKTILPNCSTDKEKPTETTEACLPINKISKNKTTENEHSKKVTTNVSQVKVTSVNLKYDTSLRSRKDSILNKSSDSSVRVQTSNDSDQCEPKRSNKRKWSDTSLSTKESITTDESLITNTKSSTSKRKPSSGKCSVESKQIQKKADSKVNTMNIQVDNIESSSRSSRLRSTNHTAVKVKKGSQKETQKTEYNSMYDNLKSNRNRRAATRNKNYSELKNDDNSLNTTKKSKKIETSNAHHDYTQHGNYSEESCSSISEILEFDSPKSHDLFESNESKSRSGSRHSEPVVDNTNFSSSEHSNRQRTNHRLSRSRSDVRNDQYKEKQKGSSISHSEKKVRFNEERSHKWMSSYNDRMSTEDNKKRELFPKMPFRVGKQGTSTESDDYEKDHKWRKKFSKLYPYTTTTNMFSKQTPYGT